MDQADHLRNVIKNENSKRSLARILTITSGKGGVGKTSISINLGIQFARMGYRVVILDADFGLSNIEVMFGIRPRYTLADLMFYGKELNEIIANGPENVKFISAGSGILKLINLNKDQLFHLTGKLALLDEQADIILIDTGAGIHDTVIEFVVASTEVLLVATPEPTSITDAYALLKTLHYHVNFSGEKTKIHLIANRVNSEKEGRELHDKLSVVVKNFLGLPLEYLSGLPQDYNMTKSIMRQTPILISNPTSSVSKSIVELAKKLINNEKDMKQSKKGVAQLFINLLKLKNRKN